jgi:predicted phage-related endonuclease
MLTLGGSEVPAVLGLDPYVSAYALGCRKLGLTSEPVMRPVMENGLRLQAAHLDWIAADGREVMPAPADGFAHPELPWLIGHPDGFAVVRKVRAPVELKLRGIAPSEALLLRDKVQAFVYAAIVGAPVALVSTVHGGYGGIVREEVEVEYDEHTFWLIVARCAEFLADLEDGLLPAPDGSASSRDALREQWAEPGEAKRADVRIMEHVAASRELDHYLKRAKAQKEQHDQAIQAFMGDATELVSPYDTPAARWRFSDRTALDTARLKRELPGVYAEYAKTTTTRRFDTKV